MLDRRAYRSNVVRSSGVAGGKILMHIGVASLKEFDIHGRMQDVLSEGSRGDEAASSSVIYRMRVNPIFSARIIRLL